MAQARHLPSKVNPLMTEEIPPCKMRQLGTSSVWLMVIDETLVARRRLGQTDLSERAAQVGTPNSTRQKESGTFDYAHLRAPLPKGIVSGVFKRSPASYFLMRRSHDGYISATGMFKATFPYAKAFEEEEERKYIKSFESTSSEETADNIWIPPHHALELAEEYHILPWIKALLDIAPIEVNPTKDASPKTISSPPIFLLPQDSLAAPSPSRRSRRSASPSKIASPKKTLAATRARKTTSKSESTEPSKIADKKSEQTLKNASPESEAKPGNNEEAIVRVHVDTDVEVKGDVETTHTHLEVEMPAGSPELSIPEDTEALIETAKEMVEAAVKANGVGPSNPKKRKAEDTEDENMEEGTEEAAPAKKVKVESELKKERVKTRALIGLSATLAIGCVSRIMSTTVC